MAHARSPNAIRDCGKASEHGRGKAQTAARAGRPCDAGGRGRLSGKPRIGGPRDRQRLRFERIPVPADASTTRTGARAAAQAPQSAPVVSPAAAYQPFAGRRREMSHRRRDPAAVISVRVAAPSSTKNPRNERSNRRDRAISAAGARVGRGENRSMCAVEARPARASAPSECRRGTSALGAPSHRSARCRVRFESQNSDRAPIQVHGDAPDIEDRKRLCSAVARAA